MVDGHGATRRGGWLRVERSPWTLRSLALLLLVLLLLLSCCRYRCWCRWCCCSCRDPGKTQKPLASAELEADNFDTYRVSSLKLSAWLNIRTGTFVLIPCDTKTREINFRITSAGRRRNSEDKEKSRAIGVPDIANKREDIIYRPTRKTDAAYLLLRFIYDGSRLHFHLLASRRKSSPSPAPLPLTSWENAILSSMHHR